MIRVVSGFAPSAREVYGDRFLATFDAHWPKSVELQVYVEEMFPMPRAAERLLWDIEGAADFASRHMQRPSSNGRVVRPGWTPKDRAKGYSFRFDAYKFFKQILIPNAAAADMRDGDILVWLDGDVETIAPVPEGFVEGLLGDHDLVYLGREPISHSEIGFWAVRLTDTTRYFLWAIANCYTSDAFLELREWHSAFVWDSIRRDMFIRSTSLSRGRSGHVWPHTALAPYLRHDKGDRKTNVGMRR